MDAGLKRAVEEKITGGARLDRADGLALYASDDLAWLGGLAHGARTARHGGTATFALTAAVAAGDTAGAAGSGDATEVQLDGVSGLALPEFLEELGRLQEALPKDRAPQSGGRVAGGTAADLLRFADAAGRPVDGVVAELAAAGLGSLAPAALPAAHEEPAVRAAHAQGVATPWLLPCEPGEGTGPFVDRVLRLRELADGPDGPGGFRVAVPAAGAAEVSGAELLKVFAVARLLLDNVPHIRASWAALGPRAVLLALQHGADDVVAPAGPAAQDPTGGPGVVDRADVVELVQDAGLVPVERTPGFTPVRGYEGPDPARRDTPQPMRL